MPQHSHQTDRAVWFYRDYRGFSGGHLVHAWYYRFTREAPGFEPILCFSAQSLPGADNPWTIDPQHSRRRWLPSSGDVCFVAGLDWQHVAPRGGIDAQNPVINLIQGFGHAETGDPRWRFLDRRAIRLCVSAGVADAIRATGRVEGPVLVIENGTDIERLPDTEFDDKVERDVADSILIVGYKNAALAGAVAEQIARHGIECHLVGEQMPRQAFLDHLRGATMVVCCPLPEEGFYLPALEAMALGCAVVVPVAGGNAAYCRDGDNCAICDYDPSSIVAGVLRLRSLPPDRKRQLLCSARDTATSRQPDRIREKYLDVLRNIDRIW